MAMLRELSNFRDGYAGRLLSSAIALAVSYLTWYAWRFYLHPMLYPREPKQYPYWIPGKSHVLNNLPTPVLLAGSAGRLRVH
jgi:hypothetical protein